MRALLSLGALGLLASCNSDFQVAAQGALLVVTPSLTDLGAVPVDEPIDFDLQVAASGGQVQVMGVDLINMRGNFFTVVDTPLPTVGDGQTAAIQLRYDPTEAGYHWADVTLSTNESSGATHTVEVRAEAGLPEIQVYPSVVDFGPVAQGSSATGVVMVHNDARALGTVVDMVLDNPRFSAATQVPFEVEGGSDVAVSLGFDAQSQAAESGTLYLDFGGTIDPVSVTLRANACDTADGSLYDHDGDGFGYCGDDCDDWDASAHPGATEVCDGVDQDCDGVIDEGTSCFDDDGDGYTEDEGDCNDGDASVYPGQVEDMDNGVDDDCDGVTDSGLGDADGDGVSVSGGDCDDGDPSAWPGATESADGVDNDCDGVVDEGTTAYDDDGDGYSEDDGDCDDTDSRTNPGAAERADWVDNDCDGAVDEGTNYGDDDGDGFSEVGGDCDDADASINPGEPEVVGDGVDNNCDGTVL